MSTRLWDRAALVPARAGARTPELAALPPDLPTVEQLFTFMRDAEMRFQTLRLRIEERTFTARGEQLVEIDTIVRHPGHARVTSVEAGPSGATSEVWISDGEVVRTYHSRHRLGTSRPIRNRPRGLGDDFPGSARVYEPITPLPTETLPELFVHPAGFCQNVLATGRCWVSGTDIVAGREAVVLECDHPRAVERVADRPDFHVQVAVDRADGIVTRLVETIAGEVTREAVVVLLEADGALPPNAFDFDFPEGTTLIY